VRVPPTRAEQAEVAERLNELHAATRRLEQLYRQKLTALAELKQSLLHKAFSGELTADKLDDAVAEAVA